MSKGALINVHWQKFGPQKTRAGRNLVRGDQPGCAMIPQQPAQTSRKTLGRTASPAPQPRFYTAAICGATLVSHALIIEVFKEIAFRIEQ